MPIATSVVASAISCNHDGEYLLIRHPVRGWEPPGGRIESGEDLAAALAREVREETGLDIQVGALMGLYQNIGDVSQLIFAFAGEVVGGELHTSEESLAIDWFSADQAMKSIAQPGTLHRFQDLLAFSNGHVRYHSFRSTSHHAMPEYQVYTQRILNDS